MAKSLSPDRTDNACQQPQHEETPPLGDNNRARIDKLLSNVNVVNDGRSYTIYISYQANNPEYSAAVANAFGEAYLDYQIDSKPRPPGACSDWLGGKLISLRATLEHSERAAADFRENQAL